MRCWLYLAAFLTGVSAAGCGAQLSKADLGTVIFEVPKVAGTDGPYQMLELAAPQDENSQSSGSR